MTKQPKIVSHDDDGNPTALFLRNRHGRNRRAGVYMMRWLRGGR